MKKILFITAFVPSKLSAAEHYTLQLISELASNYYVDLIFFQYKKDVDYVVSSENVKIIKVFKNSKVLKVLNAILFPLIFPLFTVRFNFLRLIYIQNIIKKNQYDLICFDHSQVMIYSKFIENISKIFMLHDVETQRYSRISNSIISNWCKISEQWILKSKAHIFSFSEKDRLLLNSLFNIESNVTNFFIENNIREANPTEIGDSFVLFARWGRKDNLMGLLWFIKNVLPYLNESVKIIIIGSELIDSVIKDIKKFDNVTILGFVNNPYPIIANSKALISPLFTGAGVKVKVIDSLACGTQVIGTSISFEGLPAIFSDYLIEVNDHQSFTEMINGFNTNIELKMELKQLFNSSYEVNSIPKFIEMKIFNNEK